MSDRPDPRLFPYRHDLAARGLEDIVAAPRYVDGAERQVTASAAPVMKAPSDDARLETEALFGETVTVYETGDGWSWGQVGTDGYVGYLPEHALAPVAWDTTHYVRVPRTYIFPEPDIKSGPPRLISLMARVGVDSAADGFSQLAGSGGYVFSGHLAAIGEHERDFVSVAQDLIGTPYLWGGRQTLGFDCSALVQLSLAACGVDCPRDSDMQESALGTAHGGTGLRNLQRGDLVFWKGHVAIMVDAVRMIHCNACHMRVFIEDVRGAVDRIAAAGSRVTSIRRLRSGTGSYRTGSI